MEFWTKFITKLALLHPPTDLHQLLRNNCHKFPITSRIYHSTIPGENLIIQLIQTFDFSQLIKRAQCDEKICLLQKTTELRNQKSDLLLR